MVFLAVPLDHTPTGGRHVAIDFFFVYLGLPAADGLDRQGVRNWYGLLLVDLVSGRLADILFPFRTTRQRTLYKKKQLGIV